MTVINFGLFEDAVYLVADTLVSGDDFEPAFFTTKVHVVPHWQGLITGSGALPFILDWSRMALGGMLAVDIPHLHQFAPDALRRLYDSQPEEGRRLTSTIYHFGYDEEVQKFVGYAYRSTKGFVGEQLQYGIHTKPGHSLEEMEVSIFPDHFVEVCEAQKLVDDALAPGDKVCIGGHITAYMMQAEQQADGRASITTTITRPHQFSDCDEAYQACLDRMWAAK